MREFGAQAGRRKDDNSAESTFFFSFHILVYLASENTSGAARASLAYGSDCLDETIGCIVGITGTLDGGEKERRKRKSEKKKHLHAH